MTLWALVIACPGAVEQPGPDRPPGRGLLSPHLSVLEPSSQLPLLETISCSLPASGRRPPLCTMGFAQLLSAPLVPRTNGSAGCRYEIAMLVAGDRRLCMPGFPSKAQLERGRSRMKTCSARLLLYYKLQSCWRSGIRPRKPERCSKAGCTATARRCATRRHHAGPPARRRRPHPRSLLQHGCHHGRAADHSARRQRPARLRAVWGARPLLPALVHPNTPRHDTRGAAAGSCHQDSEEGRHQSSVAGGAVSVGESTQALLGSTLGESCHASLPRCQLTGCGGGCHTVPPVRAGPCR